jgi:hypothetical protein
MDISLNLKHHCVQTEIKRQYNQSISKYFKLKTTEDITRSEAAIHLLKTALESLNFGALRSTYSELRGGGEDDVFLAAGTDGELYFIINGKKIHAILPNDPI